MKKLLMFLVLGIFLISFISFTSAWTSVDFTLDQSKQIEMKDSITSYGKYEIKDYAWYDILKIWTEEKIKEVVLEENTPECSDNCFAIKEVTNLKPMPLIEDVRFFREIDGKWVSWNSFTNWRIEVEEDVDIFETQCIQGKEIIDEKNGTSYFEQDCSQVLIGTEKQWKPLDYKKDYEGTYRVKLSGGKKPDVKYDWQVKIGGEWTTAWAVWGNISLGDDAEVTLNSPDDEEVMLTNLVTLNSTGNVTGGAYLVNATLYDNSTGTWGARNTTTISQGTFIINTTEVTGLECWGIRKVINTNFEIDNITSEIKSSSGVSISNEFRWIFTYYDGSSKTVSTSSTTASYANYSFINPDKYKRVSNITLQTCNMDYPNNPYERNSKIYPIYTSNTNVIVTFTNTFSTGNNILWNMQFCDSDGDCGFAVENRTFSIDSGVPQITLNYPTSLIDYGKLNGTLQLNFTATDTNLDKVWYDYNGTNITIAGASSGVYNISNITLSTKKNVTIYANDTAGNLNVTTFSWDYKVFEESNTFNSNSAETASETFSVNLTANASLTAVTLDYNGTDYAMTKSGTVYSKTLDIPEGISNRTLRYKLTYAGDTIYSDYFYQDVALTYFTLCNATYTTPFLNISFKDESTLANLNGTIQTSTFTYYIGSGTTNKTYTYTDSGNRSYYSFCATPDKTFYVTPYISYLGDGYPNRIWESDEQTYTSNQTNKTLYLLSSLDGIYVTFLTTTLFNTAITGVDVSITRSISGETTIVSQGVTDSAGSFTAWLNPNYDHTIIASKTGYTTNTQTIRPTQSTYTLIMSTGSDEYIYVSDYAGLKWFVYPGVGIINATGAKTFGFNITARDGNLVNCKIEILNDNKQLILASGESASANGSSCEVSTSYVVGSDYPTIKGRLLVDLGGGYQLLEDDAYWAYLAVNSTGMTITDWFKGFNSTNFDVRYFNNDEQHREYTYILIFFLFVMIVCAGLNYAGWDIQNPGAMIFLVGTFVWIASVPGFLNLANISPYTWMDQYFVAGVYSLFMIGYATRTLT